MTDPRFERLHPGRAAAVEAGEYLAGLLDAAPPPEGRPRVLANMIASLDGNAAFEGRSGGLSDAGDRALFHALRAAADAILAGSGTIAAERYRPAAKPVVTVTRSGRLPTDIPLFTDPAGRVIVFAPEAPELDGVAAEVTWEPLDSNAEMLATLARRHGISRLLCEGGPGLLGALLRDGLVDDLFLTLSANLAGGFTGTSLTAGEPAAELIPMRLVDVLEREHTLFLHYRR